MKPYRSMDSPWRRLPCTLPTALLICAVALWGLAYFMERPARREVVEPPPIDAELIELPVPPPVETPSQVVEQSVAPVQPEPPPVTPKPKPVPPVRPRTVPPAPSRVARKPAAPKAEDTAKVPEVLSGSSEAGGASDAPSAPEAHNGSRAGAPVGKDSSRGEMNANSAARAIVQPMPQIPEDLREGAFNSAALVRFHIAVDGAVEVELVKPTQNPRLNRLLLDTLKKWRFSPAVKSGQPVASTEEILVKIEVK